MTEEARDVALIAVIALAPLAIVIIIALIRGYTLDLHMRRRNGGRRRGPDEDD